MRDVTPHAHRDRVWLHVVLFLATGVTTTLAGAIQAGVNPLKDPAGVVKGLPFSVTLLVILLGHEMAHYLASRRHRVPATLPYFIPAPSLVGTFGALIRMKGAIWDRRALLDIGASGPLAGFFLSLPALVIGFALSEVVPSTGEGGVALGDSLIVALVGRLVLGDLPAAATVVLHPVGFAGWLGLFVTGLNLLPAGQLDGGHISKALFPSVSDLASRFVPVVLMAAGFLFWEGWLVWALLLLLLGVRHPPVLLPAVPLDRRRRRIGWFCAAVLILTFVPAPFSVA